MIQNPWKKVTTKAPETKSIHSFQFRKNELKWNRFLREEIHLDSGAYNMLPRHEAIRYFVEEGLEPYIQDKGYIWYKDTHGITQTILTMMFEMWQGKTIEIPNLQKKYSYEHYERFVVLLDADQWDFFWQKWGCIDDFSEHGYAYRLRFILQNFVWNAIDLENSTVTEQVNKEIAEAETTQDIIKRGGDISKGKDDPYLQDIQQAGIVRDKHTY